MNENTTPEVKVEMTVGEMLRSARTTGRRKREISTIAKLLCIREEFLEALEAGDFSAIPETVYILGFARNYAMELGLDPDDVVNRLKREMGLIDECRDADNDSDMVADGRACAVNGGDKFAFVRTAKKYVVRHWAWFAGGVAALIAIIVAVILLWPSEPDVSQMPYVAPIEINAGETDVEPKYNAPVRERFGTDNKSGGNVVLQAIEESWVKVEDARGNTVFSRVLVPGDVYYVPKGDKYKATFGNAGGVDVWVDGVQAPKQGEDHTRKSGISLSPSVLMGDAK